MLHQHVGDFDQACGEIVIKVSGEEQCTVHGGHSSDFHAERGACGGARSGDRFKLGRIERVGGGVHGGGLRPERFAVVMIGGGSGGGSRGDGCRGDGGAGGRGGDSWRGQCVGRCVGRRGGRWGRLIRCGGIGRRRFENGGGWSGRCGRWCLR